jgi:hypothetical protein
MNSLEIQDSMKGQEAGRLSEIEKRVVEGLIENISEIVEKLNVMENEIEQKREIRGEYLVATSFDYDPEASQSKRFKPRHYKAVLQHPDLTVNPRRLSEDVKVALFNREADERKIDVSQLPFTHKLVLARMEDRNKAFALVPEALAEGYTVEQLKAKAGNKEKKAGQARGIIRHLKAYQTGPNGSSSRNEALELAKSKELLLSELTIDDRELIQAEASKIHRAMETHMELLSEVEHVLFEILSDSMTQRKNTKE